MAQRNIRIEGDPILAKKARLVEHFDDHLAELLDDMSETMYKKEGVGLAATQIGILRRVAVVDIGEGLIELVNPQIIKTEGEQKGSEGCLSCPGEYGITLRPMKVDVLAQDRYGNEFKLRSEGLKARVFCHEIDHLDGILFKEHLVD